MGWKAKILQFLPLRNKGGRKRMKTLFKLKDKEGQTWRAVYQDFTKYILRETRMMFFSKQIFSQALKSKKSSKEQIPFLISQLEGFN